ncbi:hypothetical protein NFJ02_20g41670 [Pycnococcus provasolii]
MDGAPNVTRHGGTGLYREARILLGTACLVVCVLGAWGALLETCVKLLSNTPLLVLSSLPSGRTAENVA